MEDAVEPPPPSEQDVSAWSAGAAVRACLIAAFSLSLGGALGYVVMNPNALRGGGRTASSNDGSRPPAPRAPLDASDTAFVAPLVAGFPVLDFEVRRLEPAEGSISIVLAKGADEVELHVERAGDRHPPASFGGYGVMYLMRGVGPREGARLATEVARLLQPHAASPPPSALRSKR